ncbi:tRNA-dihydrouridine synthase [Candidatus Uhrbacteria bacterium]|nr:tRNA-dihydrouridine synthase [Candidatus Uhrbacteria bacterium]
MKNHKNFWSNLPSPFFVLAPMANVTDAAFRSIIAKYGKPDVMITEFVSCHGLCSKGRENILPDLWYSEIERPIVAQIFGSEPEHFYKCAQFLAEKGFDGIDINMGCPDKNVEKQGAGAALIKDPKRAQEIIRATKRGAPHLPVSVKTRLGYSKITIDEWFGYLLEMGLSAITVHGRTRKEMSKVPAHWDAIAQVVEMAKKYDSSIKRPRIIGNGDVSSLVDARDKAKEYGVDGVMIGRGIFGNPWLFDPQKKIPEIPLEERLRVMMEHTKLFEEKFTNIKPFDLMKKHYKAYVSGFEGAKELRVELMKAKNSEHLERILKERHCV